jgi:hypothetical protein
MQGPLVSERPTFRPWYSVEVRGDRRGGIIVVLPMGQNRHFTSHFLLLHCGEDGAAVRGGLRSDGRYGALRSSSTSWLGYGARGRVGRKGRP